MKDIPPPTSLLSPSLSPSHFSPISLFSHFQRCTHTKACVRTHTKACACTHIHTDILTRSPRNGAIFTPWGRHTPSLHQKNTHTGKHTLLNSKNTSSLRLSVIGWQLHRTIFFWCNPALFWLCWLDIVNLASLSICLSFNTFKGCVFFFFSSHEVWLLSVHPWFSCGVSDVTYDPLNRLE